MNLTPLQEALGEMCEARKAWRIAWKAYEAANAAKQAADARLLDARAHLDHKMDAMIEAHK